MKRVWIAVVALLIALGGASVFFGWFDRVAEVAGPGAGVPEVTEEPLDEGGTETASGSVTEEDAAQPGDAEAVADGDVADDQGATEASDEDQAAVAGDAGAGEVETASDSDTAGTGDLNADTSGEDVAAGAAEEAVLPPKSEAEFDIVRVEPGGSALIAGTGVPGATMRLVDER